MQALTVYPLVYILELEDGCWYVGSSINLNVRLAQHWCGQGSGWTKKHAPTRVHEVILVREGSALEVENSATLAYIAQYGAEKVRGGSYTRV